MQSNVRITGSTSDAQWVACSHEITLHDPELRNLKLRHSVNNRRQQATGRGRLAIFSTAGETNVAGSELQTTVRKWDVSDMNRPYMEQESRPHVCCYLPAHDTRKSGRLLPTFRRHLLPPFATQKTKPADSSETLLTNYHTARRHNPRTAVYVVTPFKANT
jgi:hypothetical protein